MCKHANQSGNRQHIKRNTLLGCLRYYHLCHCVHRVMLDYSTYDVTYLCQLAVYKWYNGLYETWPLHSQWSTSGPFAIILLTYGHGCVCQQLTYKWCWPANPQNISSHQKTNRRQIKDVYCFFNDWKLIMSRFEFNLSLVQPVGSVLLTPQ